MSLTVLTAGPVDWRMAAIVLCEGLLLWYALSAFFKYIIEVFMCKLLIGDLLAHSGRQLS